MWMAAMGLAGQSFEAVARKGGRARVAALGAGMPHAGWTAQDCH